MRGFGERDDVAGDRLVVLGREAESDLLHVDAQRASDVRKRDVVLLRIADVVRHRRVQIRRSPVVVGDGRPERAAEHFTRCGFLHVYTSWNVETRTERGPATSRMLVEYRVA